MTKILLLAASNTGTIGMCTRNLYEAFKNDDRVIVKLAVVHHNTKGLEGFEDATYFEGSCFDKIGVSILNQIKWLRSLKKHYKPDVTISTLFSVNTINTLAGGCDKKIGIFHSPHQQLKALGKIHYLGTLFNFKFIFPHLDYLFCVSEEVKDSLKQFRSINNKKIKVVYNIHNINKINKLSTIELEDDTERLIFKNNVILYCGRLDHNKSPERSILAFKQANLRENYCLVFIGSDPYNLIPKLKKLALSLSIQAKVIFLGIKTNPYQYMRRSTMLISSSFSEGLPGVMIESLVLGKPVVSTNSSMGVWEIFSAVKMYDPNLKNVFENECGVITSNQGKTSLTIHQSDVENLSKGISVLANRQNSVVKFNFIDEIKPCNIIDSIFNCEYEN